MEFLISFFPSILIYHISISVLSALCLRRLGREITQNLLEFRPRRCRCASGVTLHHRRCRSGAYLVAHTTHITDPVLSATAGIGSREQLKSQMSLKAKTMEEKKKYQIHFNVESAQQSVNLSKLTYSLADD